MALTPDPSTVGARILVADDDPSIRQTVTWLLTEHGYDVVAVASGDELFEMLEVRLPDLLLLDVIMPGVDGIQALARIKSDERWRDLPVLMLSSLSAEDATATTLGLGADDFVRKPFRVKELLARIQAQLRMRALLRSAREALRTTEQELSRAREEAESRRKLVDILHEVTGDLSSDEIYHLLARRVARALTLTHCSVILARPGDRTGMVATAYENPGLRHREVVLDRYPEIRAALDRGRPVLIEDVSASPLFDGVREMWEREGERPTIRSVIALPFTLDRLQAGVFFLRRTVDEPPLTVDDVEFADTVVKAAVASIQKAQLLENAKADNARLEALAHTDPLTQLLNRRALVARLAAELDRARRYDSVVSLLMIDLDHFKQVNDRYGHPAGDVVLREIGRVLPNSLRPSDVVCRYGGEEFCLVLPDADGFGAEKALASLAARLRDLRVTWDGETLGGFSFSAGVAVLGVHGTTFMELLAAADRALYEAKRAGRNRVFVATLPGVAA